MYTANSPVIPKKDKVHLSTTANSHYIFVNQNKSKISIRPHQDCEGTFHKVCDIKVPRKTANSYTCTVL